MGRSRLPPVSIRCLAKVGDQRHARRHAGMDQLVGGGHVGGDQGMQPLDRRNAGLVDMFLKCCWPAHRAQDTGPHDARQAAHTDVQWRQKGAV